MTIEINGMAHVILTVSNFATAREFYRRFLPEFGMKVVSDDDRFFYCVGARTAIGIQASKGRRDDEGCPRRASRVPTRAVLHHRSPSELLAPRSSRSRDRWMGARGVG